MSKVQIVKKNTTPVYAYNDVVSRQPGVSIFSSSP
jgi:hypothetical protein